MADIGISKFRVQIPRSGSIPSTPGFAESEGQDPVNPPGSPTGVYVPYLGATGSVNLGEFGLTTGNLIFDTTPTNIPTAQGAMYWDVDDETVALIMNGAIQKVGEDSFYQVKNQTGSNIAKGVAVRFAGTVGNSGRLLIAPFLADGTYPSTYFMGVTMEEIPNGEDGKVIWFGRIRGINTNAYNEEDILYASTTVAGGFQTSVPQAPNNIVEVCTVVTKSINQGVIFVRPTLGSNINRDEGVKIISPTNGQALVYNSTSQLWENGNVGTETVQVVSTSGTINDLSTTATTVVFTGATVTLTGIVAISNGFERTLINLTGSTMTLSYFSSSSSTSNRFLFSLKLPNRGVAKIKYSTDATNVWLLSSGNFQSNNDQYGAYSNDFISIGRTPANNIGLTIRSVSDTDSAYSIACERLNGTRSFEVRSLSIYSFVQSYWQGTSGYANQWVRATSVGNWATIWQDSSGTQKASVNDQGGFNGLGDSSFGISDIYPTSNTRVAIRGKGTTTQNTLLLEDLSGNDTFAFLDNGNLSIPSTNGAKIGTATSQKIGFWNATPIVQPTTAVASATRVGGGGTTLTDTDTFDGYTLAQIVKALRNAGLLA